MPANENENKLFPIFLDEQTGRVPGNGSPDAAEKAGPNRESKLAEIILKLDDPDVPVLEVKRLIAKEIVLTMQYMRTLGGEGSAAAERQSCLTDIKILKMLDAMKMERWAQHDVLNFDGPKFKFVLGRTIDYIKEAILEAGGSEHLQASILRHLRDIAAVDEENLRRETQRLSYKDVAPGPLHWQEASERGDSPKTQDSQQSRPSKAQSASESSTKKEATENATRREYELSGADKQPKTKQDERTAAEKEQDWNDDETDAEQLGDSEDDNSQAEGEDGTRHGDPLLWSMFPDGRPHPPKGLMDEPGDEKQFYEVIEEIEREVENGPNSDPPRLDDEKRSDDKPEIDGDPDDD